MQCCGFGMIYSGSGSSYEFLKFRIGIQFRIWIQFWIWIQPILFKHIWRLLKKTHLKFNHQKEEFTNYLPISVSYYSPTVHTVQKIFIYLLFQFLLHPEPGKSSGSMRVRIQNTAQMFCCCRYSADLGDALH